MKVFKQLFSLVFILVIVVPLYGMEQAADIFDEKLTLGNSFLEKKDYINALTLYKSALQQDTNMVAKRTAQQKLATLFGKQYQLLEPYLLEHAQQATNLTTKAKAAVALGELYQRNNEFEKATPFLTYSEQQNIHQTAKAEARVILAQIFLEKNEFQKAIPYLSAILDQPRVSEYIKATALGSLGFMYQLLDHYPAAITYFHKATEQTVNSTASLISKGQLGQLYLKTREFKKALPYLTEVARQAEAPFLQADALYWLGVWYLLQNEYTQAIENLNLVATQDINPKARAAGLLLLGRVSMELKKYDNALSYFEQAASQQDHLTVQKEAQVEIERIHGAQNLATFDEQTMRHSKRERALEKATILEGAPEAALKKSKEEGQ